MSLRIQQTSIYRTLVTFSYKQNTFYSAAVQQPLQQTFHSSLTSLNYPKRRREHNRGSGLLCFTTLHVTWWEHTAASPWPTHTHVPQLSRLHPLLPYTTDSQKQYTTKIRHSKSFVIHRSKVTNTHLLFKKINCRKQSQLTLLVQRKFCTTGPQVTTRRYWVFIVTHWFCVFLFDGQNHSNKQHPTAMDSTTFTVITDHSSETYTMQYMTKMATLMS